MRKVMLMLCLVAGVLAADDRAEILEGVKVINAKQGTLPGSVLCVKEEAFPLVAGNADGALMPVASAARYGRGKIVAVGHPSFYSADSLKLADTEKFVRNALQWLGGGQIGIYSYNEAISGISSLDGLAVKTVNTIDEIKDCQVLVVYPDSMKNVDELEVLRQFILDGGGVLTSGIGWGWKQITNKNLQTENYFNKLFGPAGLLVDDSFVNRPNSEGYPVAAELPEELNVAKALAFAKDLDAKLKLVNKTLTTARTVMADDGSDLAKDFDALIARGNRGAPSMNSPWRTADLVKRLAAIDFTKNWQANPLGEYKAHPGARNYPGMPPKDSPRVAEKIVTIDLTVPRWHSTGLFAVAENRDVLVGQCLGDEDRHSRRIRAFRILARSEYVEITQTGSLQTTRCGEHRAIIFAVQFGDRIRAFGFRRHGFHFRGDRIVAVIRRGSAQNQFFHSGFGGFLQQDDGALGVDLVAFDDFFHRFRHADQRRQMEDVINAFDRFGNRGAVAHIPFDQFTIQTVQIGTPSGPETVQYPDFALPLKLFYDVAADESGSAGH